MRHEPVELHERPGVEQHVESLPGGHLALFVLRGDTPGATAKLGFGALLLQQLQLLTHSHKAKSRREETGQLRTRRTDAQGRTRVREQELLLPLAVFPCASAASVRLVLTASTRLAFACPAGLLPVHRLPSATRSPPARCDDGSDPPPAP